MDPFDPTSYPDDIFTEPEPDDDTLAHLGPLRGLAGSWHGSRGSDTHPHEDGTESDDYDEWYVAHPIDAQTNGPQLFYGLRYHTRIVKKGGRETFHDQVGYWLWEPDTNLVILTLAIPRGQTAMCSGITSPDSREFTVTAHHGDPTFGILTNPFLDDAFRTTEFSMTVRITNENEWSYDQVTSLEVRGRPGVFAHRDTNVLMRTEGPRPNPLLASR